MVKKNLKFLLAPAVLSLLPLQVAEAGTVYSQGKATTVLGSTLGADLEAGTNATKQVTTSFKLTNLSVSLQALFAILSPPNTIGGTTYTEVYSFGKRVFSDSSYVFSNGSNLAVGLAPTQIRVPFVVYPVGPVLLKVDGGARFQANLALNNITNISIPIKYSEPGFQLQAVAAGAGFIEAYASFFFLRAGAGGQLDLVDARVDVNTRIALEEGAEPLVQVSAIAEFLKGRLYAFVDVFGIFAWGWKRLVDYELYHWNGFCFATGYLQCPAGSS